MPVGRVVYTPLLTEAGGIVADLTIMRLGHDRFRVVTGGGMGMRDKKWFADHLPADGSAQLHDVDLGAVHARRLGPAGARPRWRPPTSDDVSNAGFPFGTCRTIEIGGVDALASRISLRRRARLGDLRADGAGPAAVGHALGRRPGVRGRRRSGSACTRTTGRLEKGYRAHGAELELEFDLVEAGMARPKVKDADFVGKAAYLAQRDGAAGRGPVHADASTIRRSIERRRALHARARADPGAATAAPLVDAKGRRSYVTSAGVGPVGRQAPADVLPAAGAGRRRAPSCWSSTSASAIR